MKTSSQMNQYDPIIRYPRWFCHYHYCIIIIVLCNILSMIMHKVLIAEQLMRQREMRCCICKGLQSGTQRTSNDVHYLFIYFHLSPIDISAREPNSANDIEAGMPMTSRRRPGITMGRA